MNIFQLFLRDDRTIPPPGLASPLPALSRDTARESHGQPPTANDAGLLASAGWDGTDRRNNTERRSSDRRQQGQESPLDTRTGNDRRRDGRRATDQQPVVHLSIKI